MKEIIKIKHKESALFGEEQIADTAAFSVPYLNILKKAADDPLYAEPEASVHLPFDTSILDKAASICSDLANPDLRHIFVIGIGGSSLGAQAVYEAIFLKQEYFSENKKPLLHFADMNNPRQIAQMMEFAENNIKKPSEVVVNIVTKSGTTTETLANAALLFNLLEKKFGEKESYSRIVVTTDENSSLWNVAREKEIKTLTIPRMVGGRYSVFSSVAIFPLMLAGVNVQELLNGAEEAVTRCFLSDVNENPALLGAVLAFLGAKAGQNIYNNFFFNSEMEYVGKWLRQLTAESLGKRTDKNGNAVSLHATPIVSIGSADLHSMVQLYLCGVKDKFTNFIYTDDAQKGLVVVPQSSPFGELNPSIFGQDFGVITRATLCGTMEAYKAKGIAYIETTLPDISEFSIGAFLQVKMIETMIHADLLKINAFDQPDVESYKKVTKELLKLKQ